MANESSSTAVHKLECRELTLKQVTVFNDRAELKRTAQFNVEPGLNALYIENVSQNIINESVRIDGRGDGIIHNVQLQDKPAIHEETDSPKVAEVRAKYNEKLDHINALKDREATLQKKIEALDKVVVEFGCNVIRAPKDIQGSCVLSKETLDSLTSFYTFYDENSLAIRAEHRDVKKSIEKGDRELKALLLELNGVEAGSKTHQFSRSIVVDLESNEGGFVELEVSYQVYGASWHPSYDMRVETSGQQSLKITYFGNITQSTGEDWSNAALVLSTAQPCLGGEIPELGTLEAIFYRPPPPQVEPQYMARNFKSASTMFGAAPQPVQESAFLNRAPLQHAVATPTQQNALSAEFKIVKPASIPSDGSEYKVTIGLIDVIPQFIHQCVPSKNTNTFLIAFAINSSSFPFLPGDAAIYLNNSFVAKRSMKNVWPGESFICSLGVDPAIHIDYKPVKKCHGLTGIISKSSSTAYEQIIVIKNSHGDSVLLTVKEQIPRSTDEKIKVRLIAPVVPNSNSALNNEANDIATVAKLPQEGSKLLDGILEWTVAIQSGKSVELHVKWEVEHPRDEVVHIVERH